MRGPEPLTPDAPTRRSLVISRDRAVLSELASALPLDGFAVETSVDPRPLASAPRGAYDVILVDMDGVDVPFASSLDALRACGDSTPIVALATFASPRDATALLRAGADDALAKPLDLEALLARLHMLARRVEAARCLQVGALEIDLVGGIARFDGVDLGLSARELALLAHLAVRRRLVTKAELRVLVWQDTSLVPLSNVLDVTMNRLRERLGAAESMIRRVPGIGYALELEPFHGPATTPVRRPSAIGTSLSQSATPRSRVSHFETRAAVRK